MSYNDCTFALLLLEGWREAWARRIAPVAAAGAEGKNQNDVDAEETNDVARGGGDAAGDAGDNARPPPPPLLPRDCDDDDDGDDECGNDVDNNSDCDEDVGDAGNDRGGQ